MRRGIFKLKKPTISIDPQKILPASRPSAVFFPLLFVAHLVLFLPSIAEWSVVLCIYHPRVGFKRIHRSGSGFEASSSFVFHDGGRQHLRHWNAAPGRWWCAVDVIIESDQILAGTTATRQDEAHGFGQFRQLRYVGQLPTVSQCHRPVDGRAVVAFAADQQVRRRRQQHGRRRWRAQQLQQTYQTPTSPAAARRLFPRPIQQSKLTGQFLFYYYAIVTIFSRRAESHGLGSKKSPSAQTMSGPSPRWAQPPWRRPARPVEKSQVIKRCARRAEGSLRSWRAAGSLPPLASSITGSSVSRPEVICPSLLFFFEKKQLKKKKKKLIRLLDLNPRAHWPLRRMMAVPTMRLSSLPPS